jgi:hypothetical protein
MRVYWQQARRNQDNVTVRTNRSYRITKKSRSNGPLTASKRRLTVSKRHPGKHESVGLHSTLEQEIREYMADPGHARCNVHGRQSSLQGVPTGSAEDCESAARHLTGGIADSYYLQLADQMLGRESTRNSLPNGRPDFVSPYKWPLGGTQPWLRYCSASRQSNWHL